MKPCRYREVGHDHHLCRPSLEIQLARECCVCGYRVLPWGEEIPPKR